MNVSKSPSLDEVLPLSEVGIAVHLLRPRSKAPIADDWSVGPRMSPAQLRKQHREGQNFGIRLGRPSEIDGQFLHVIDLDIRQSAHAEQAKAKLRELLPECGSLPAVISGSGGESRHFYFLSPKPFASKKLAHSAEKFTDAAGKSHWAWEIELFGTGKQVAAPPSIHPVTGKPYRWLRQLDLDALARGVGPFVAPERVKAWVGAVAPPAAETEKPPLDLEDRDVRDVLKRLNLDTWCEDREGWLKVGLALHHQFEGSETGYDLWCWFSQQSDKFVEEDQRRNWESFKGATNAFTFASLLHETRDSRLADKFEDLGAAPAAEDEDPFDYGEGGRGEDGKPKGFVMSPFSWVDPKAVPRRQWLYGTSLVRGYVSVLVAPGGLGKSALALLECLAMASGRNILGDEPHEGAVAVCYINLEDPKDELLRRTVAAMKHHDIKPEEIEGRLFLNGSDTRLCIAQETREGVKILKPTITQIREQISKNKIAALVVDPFVSSHQVSENDNAKIDRVAKTWAGIAREENIALRLVHHTRKLSGGQKEQGAEDSRGAKALTDAARVVQVLNRMNPETAKGYGLDRAWSYFRVDDGKSNLAPPSDKAVWRHLVSVDLENRSDWDMDDGDRVGVVEAWEVPEGPGLPATEVNRLLALVKGGDWRRDPRAKDWIGLCVASALKLDPEEDRERVRKIVEDLFKIGCLATDIRKDDRRRDREFVVVRRMLEDFENLDADDDLS